MTTGTSWVQTLKNRQAAAEAGNPVQPEPYPGPANEVGPPFQTGPYVNGFNVSAYGGSLADAYAAAHSAGGGVVYAGAGIWDVDGLVWTDGTVQLQGVGAATILKATSAGSSVLDIEIPGGGAGLFRDFVVDGNGLATNPIVQHISSETSVGTRFARVHAKNAAAGAFQWINNGCEDTTYLDCGTPGNESSPGSIPPAIQVVVPTGQVRFLGGEFFGPCDFEYQQISAYGTVLGPIIIENSGTATDRILDLSGCYVYDGAAYGGNGGQCIGVNGSLTPVIATGCTFVAQLNSAFINGNIPAGVSISLLNPLFVWGPGTAGNIYGVQGSGAGYVNYLGLASSVGAGTFNKFNPISGATTVVTTIAGQ